MSEYSENFEEEVIGNHGNSEVEEERLRSREVAERIIKAKLENKWIREEIERVKKELRAINGQSANRFRMHKGKSKEFAEAIGEYDFLKKRHKKIFDVGLLITLHKKVKVKENKVKEQEIQNSLIKSNLFVIEKNFLGSTNAKTTELQKIEASQLHSQLAKLIEKSIDLEESIKKSEEDYQSNLEKELENNVKISKLDKVLQFFIEKNGVLPDTSAYRRKKYFSLVKDLKYLNKKSANEVRYFEEITRILESEIANFKFEAMKAEKILAEKEKKIKSLYLENENLYEPLRYMPRKNRTK